MNAAVLSGCYAIERYVTLEGSARVSDKVAPESLRPLSLVSLNHENETVSIAAILAARENWFVIRVMRRAYEIGSDRRPRRKGHREFLTLRSERNPGEFILKRSSILVVHSRIRLIKDENCGGNEKQMAEPLDVHNSSNSGG